MTSVDDILRELFEADPALRASEPALRNVIERLLHEQPNATADKAFIERLRMALREHAHSLTPHSPSPTLSLTSPFSMKTIHVALGSLVAVAILVPTVYFGLNPMKKQMALHTTNTPLFTYSIVKRPNQAFGNLSTQATDRSASMGVAMGMAGGGGGGSGIAAPAPATNAEDAKMMAPGMVPQDIIQYDYSLTGDIPALTDTTVPVLLRDKNAARIDLNAVNAAFDLGIIDPKTFPGARIDSLSFTQDTDFGYMVYVSLAEGSISVNQNWMRWPHPESACRDDACYRAMQLKPDDVPADDVLIGIANAFIQEHGIDLSHYGAPVVDHQWRLQYAQATATMPAYVPEQQQVTYPLMVEGKTVYEEGGMTTGIQVSVDVRNKKVAGVWNLVNQTYQRSDYPAVTDATRVAEYLKKLDQISLEGMPKGTSVKHVTIELGAPTMGYGRFYVYDQGKGTGDEVLVPSLIFPVTKTPENTYYWRSAVVVPLAEDLFSRQFPGGPIPMPLAAEDTPVTTGEAEPAVDTTAPAPAVVPKG